MEINQLVEEAHKNAVEKGWHESERNPLEHHALFHSEISEATEEVRVGNSPMYFEPSLSSKKEVEFIKPQGEAIELADVVIRIADYFGMKGWDLEEVIRLKMEFNKTRPYRHGGKLY